MDTEPDVKNSASARVPGDFTAKTPEAITVSELNHVVGRQLERSFPLLTVRGELSNFSRAASGHWYFTLKDSAAQVRCAMFRARSQYVAFTPREGDEVEVRVQVRLYEPRGEFQLLVDAMQRSGRGGLLEAFMRLKADLAAQGLFDTERKRALPAFARRVGVVTSLEAAALRDVVTTLAIRAPHVSVIVYPTLVQGDAAASRIAAAIQLANQRAEVDVLIVCRGGGSIEDLWAFNEPVVAYAIAGSTIPVVSGVGHETDTTIADFVADLRASTPTAAAQLAARLRSDWLTQLNSQAGRLDRNALRVWERCSMQLDAVSARLPTPAIKVAAMAARLQELQGRFNRAVASSLAQADLRLQHLASLLRALSPGATLERGFAIVELAGVPVTSSTQVESGQTVDVKLRDGSLVVTVNRVNLAPNG